MMTRKRRKKVLKLAKGYWGAKSKHFKMAKQAVMKAAITHILAVSTEKEIFAACGLPVYPPPAASTV